MVNNMVNNNHRIYFMDKLKQYKNCQKNACNENTLQAFICDLK